MLGLKYGLKGEVQKVGAPDYEPKGVRDFGIEVLYLRAQGSGYFHLLYAQQTRMRKTNFRS